VKPSGLKPKATKLLKVSTQTVSEEVEVAEALFDLARMIPSPSALDRRMDSKSEYKSEAKSYSSASVQITSPVAQPSNGTATPPLLAPVANTTSTVPLGASQPPAASPVLPPCPSSAAALPPEEGNVLFLLIILMLVHCQKGLSTNALLAEFQFPTFLSSEPFGVGTSFICATLYLCVAQVFQPFREGHS
jgi:hypothetical protein